MAVVVCSLSAAIAQEPAVTRWSDPSGQPRPAHRPLASGGALSLTAGTAEFPSGGSPTNRICLIVHENVAAAAGEALARYRSDLTAAGYSTVSYTYHGGSAESVRAYLAGLYAESNSLVGAVLIGSIPYVIYELEQNWGYGDEYEDFACDLFYMDLNGTWTDTNSVSPFSAGKYDTRGGNLDADIWVSRLKGDNLPSAGAESVLIDSYFDKDHRYRTRQLIPNRRALIYDDDDWHNMASDDASYLNGAYVDCGLRAVMDGDATTAANFKYHLGTSYELIAVRSHGWSGGHGFYENGMMNFNNIYASDYLQQSPAALFYSFFVCSGCDFTAPDNLGSVVVLNTNDSGLVCWGSTKTGGMLYDESFYGPLARGACVGAAFREWFNRSQSNYPSMTPRWFYGMVVLGDGTLTLAGNDPVLTNCEFAGATRCLRTATRQGDRYQLLRASTLNAGAWSSVGDAVTSDGFALSLSDAEATGVVSLYCVATVAGPSNLLRNASFEIPAYSDDTPRNWTSYNPDDHGGSSGNVARVDWRCHYGATEAALRGTWAGASSGQWWQEAAAHEGSNYEASVWCWADQGTYSGGPWTAVVQRLTLEFLTSGYQPISSNSVTLADIGELWTQKVLRATAPPNTSWARVLLEVSGAGGSGALQCDDAELVMVP